MRITDPKSVQGRRQVMTEVAEAKLARPFRDVTQAVVAEIPDEFFTAPSSSSGKFHPEWALGDGGLWRHSLAVVQMCEHLLRLYEFTARYQVDAVLGAALIHDGFKGWDGFRWRESTVPDHGKHVAECLRRVAEGFEPNAAVELAALAAERHMCQWAEEPFHHCAQHDIVRLLSTADFVVSRRDSLPVFD